MTSIRVLMPLMVSVQIAAAVGLTGFLSFVNGQKAVNDVASNLRNQVAIRIEEHLNDYLAMPHLVTSTFVNQLELGLLPATQLMAPDNLKVLEQYFWRESQLFDSVGYLFVANENGEFVGLEKLDNGDRTFELAERATGGDFRTYSITEQGTHNQLIKEPSPGYDPQQRPYYSAAVNAGKPAWTDIYAAFGYADRLTITAVQPVYQRSELGEPQNVLGVVGADLILSQITQFLDGLDISESGVAFILDSTGRLVATSAQESIVLQKQDGTTERLLAVDSNNALVQSTARKVQEDHGGFREVGGTTLEVTEGNKRSFVEVRSLQDFDLDWMIVVVIPEADFMAQINANTRSTIILCVGALIAASVIASLTARWLVQPIVRLCAASTSIESERFKLDLLDTDINRKDEFGQLARVFHKMAQQVQSRAGKMKYKINQLQSEVEQTRHLQAMQKATDDQMIAELIERSRQIRNRK